MSLRDLLKSKELGNDVIEEIMAEHGKIVTTHTTRTNNLETELKNAKATEIKQETLDGLQKKIDDLTKEKEELQSTYDRESEQWTEAEASMKFDRLVEKAISESKAIDEISTKTHLAEFLKEAKLSEDGKRIEGLSEKLTELKEPKTHLLAV